MDKKHIRFLLDAMDERLIELYANTEIGGDDMDDFTNWIELIRKELMYDDIIKLQSK